jgi:GTPase Era involved in 16S rRNA processing
MDTLRYDTERQRDRTVSDTLVSELDGALTVLRACVGCQSPLVARLNSLRERLDHKRLQLAVLGQFKRGKSTFINALLGAPLLPIAVVPLTAVPIFISWRADPLVRVGFMQDRPPEQITSHHADAIREFLFRFVAEEANPKNRLGVDRVDLCYPAEILADGTVLIDTPGVGSTFRHNTEAAFRVIPECDAVLFVVSADPPLTDTELDYLRQLKPAALRIFFILNKVDYLAPEERERIVQFLETVLRENGVLQPDTEIFCVSARNGLAAKQANDAEQLETSGIGNIEAHLISYLAKEKTRVLEAAIRSKAASALSQAESEVRLHLQALRMPIEDFASKSRAFEDALKSMEERRRVTRDLLVVEQRRLREDLEIRIDELRNDVRANLIEIVDKAIETEPDRWESTVRRTAPPAIEEAFLAAQQKIVPAFSQMTNTILAAHQGRIHGLVDVVRRTAADIFNVPFPRDLEHEPFQLAEEPYWITERIRPTLIPDPSRLIDQLVPRRVRTRRLRGRIVGQMKELVVRNAENLRWAILRGMDETFRTVCSQFEEQLDSAAMATKNVIKEALTRRRDSSVPVEREVSRLNRAVRSLSVAREELTCEQRSNTVEGSRHSAAIG